MIDGTDPQLKGPSSIASQGGLESADLGPLIEVLADLNIARKQILIYPAEHELVQRSLKKAFERISLVLADMGEFSCAVAKDTLMLGGHLLDGKNPAFKELAHALRQSEVAAVTFERGLSREDLIGFLMGLAGEQGSAQSMRSPARARDLAHVRLHKIDYSGLQVTKEQQIERSSAPDSTRSIWNHFAARMVSGGAAREILDPHALAGRLNETEANPEQALSVYTELLSQHLERGTGEETPLPADVERGLGAFNTLIKALNPELRRQFLSVTFKHCAQAPAETSEGLMRGLGREFVLQMLHYATSENREISPSLLKLIQSIGHLSPTAPRGAAAKPGELTPGDMQALLNRENYETFVDSDYNQMLADIGQPSARLALKQGMIFDLETGLEDQVINSHAAKAMLRLMVVSADTASYRDWARQVTLMMDDLVATGSFDGLLDVLTLMRTERDSQPDEERRKIADLVVRSFSAPDFVAGLVPKIESTQVQPSGAALELLLKMGEPVVVELMDGLEAETSVDALRQKINLLTPFGVLAAREALHRLNHPQPEVVCIMLKLIRRLGDRQSVDPVRLYLDHADERIRMEALATLVKFGNPWGVLRLRDLMGAAWSERTADAFDMAGKYRVREVAPQLMDFIVRRGPLKMDFERREASLRALGRIGDPVSVPVLEKLISRRNLFGAGKIKQLKNTAFKSLQGYPFQAVAALVHKGLKHSDEDIRELCRGILRRNHKRTEAGGPSGTANPTTGFAANNEKP